MPERIDGGIALVPERPSNIAVVEACSMLNALSSEERQKIAGESFMAYAERGEMIFAAGAQSETVAIVGTGFVKMTKASAAGQEMAVELLGPGQGFGLLAAIEGRAYPLTAVAVTNCWYLKAPTRALLPMYRENGAFKDSIVRSLAPRLRKAHDMMLRLSSVRVEERLAAVLFILGDTYGVSEGGHVRISVPLTRQDVAEMAGTTVETTIRTFSRWQKSGILATDRQRLTILDEHALEEIMHA
ncbi:Crp/Fnr family transcriptional regulator [bacterium]|nr:MAG: Crp/Fnr family transcriptional regulator [bacterium]